MSDLQPEDFERLIDRYLTGDLDPETSAQMRVYLDSHPGRRGVMAGLHAIGAIDRTIYHGAYPEGAAIRFTTFEMWTTAAE